MKERERERQRERQREHRSGVLVAGFREPRKYVQLRLAAEHVNVLPTSN